MRTRSNGGTGPFAVTSRGRDAKYVRVFWFSRLLWHVIVLVPLDSYLIVQAMSRDIESSLDVVEALDDTHDFGLGQGADALPIGQVYRPTTRLQDLELGEKCALHLLSPFPPQ